MLGTCVTFIASDDKIIRVPITNCCFREERLSCGGQCPESTERRLHASPLRRRGSRIIVYFYCNVKTLWVSINLIPYFQVPRRGVACGVLILRSRLTKLKGPYRDFRRRGTSARADVISRVPGRDASTCIPAAGVYPRRPSTCVTFSSNGPVASPRDHRF